MPTNRTPSSVKFASQVHAEAVTIVALRAFADTIQDYESAHTIRLRLRRWMQLKLAAIGLNESQVDEAINESARLMDQADKIAGDLLKKVAAK